MEPKTRLLDTFKHFRIASVESVCPNSVSESTVPEEKLPREATETPTEGPRALQRGLALRLASQIAARRVESTPSPTWVRGTENTQAESI